MTIRVPKRVETPVNQSQVSNETKAKPAESLEGKRFKFGKPEADAMLKAVTTQYDVPSQKKVVAEFHRRFVTGSVTLTRDAATELNKLAQSLGVEVEF